MRFRKEWHARKSEPSIFNPEVREVQFNLSRWQTTLGDCSERVPPVPIPNTEVKPCRADDTALVTARERRSPPGLKFKGRPSSSGRPFSFLPRAISAAVNLPDFYWMPTKPVTVLYSAFYTLTRWKTSDAYF